MRSLPSFLFPSLRGYRRRWLPADVMAGLTVWAVLVPEALAYATIADVSPVVGLYAAPPALLLYAAFGTSRHVIAGPVSATAALSATAVTGLAGPGDDVTALTAALALTTGVVVVLAGVARLGFLSSLISEPVFTGFIIGMACTIIIGEVPKFFGVAPGEGAFFEALWDLLARLDRASLATLGVGLASLAVVLGLRRWVPRAPGSLIVVVLGVLAVALFDLDRHGVAVVGHVESGLPHFGLPDVPAGDYRRLAGAAFGVMVVGLAEGLGAARTFAVPGREPIKTNRELVAMGAANLGAGLSSGMVVGGSLSKTAVGATAGSRSEASALVVAVLTAVTLFATGLVENLLEATLAAVVIAAVAHLVDMSALARLRRAYTPRLRSVYGISAATDLAAALAALAGVLVFNILPGLVIGVVVSWVLLGHRSAHPHVAELGLAPGARHFTDLLRDRAAERIPGVVVLRPETGLFFANAEKVRNTVLVHVARQRPAAVVIDAETVPFIDLVALRMLDDLVRDLGDDGVHVAIGRGIGQVQDTMQQVADPEGPRHAYPTVHDAVAAVAPGGWTPPVVG